jgi:hypothetical protein
VAQIQLFQIHGQTQVHVVNGQGVFVIKFSDYVVDMVVTENLERAFQIALTAALKDWNQIGFLQPVFVNIAHDIVEAEYDQPQDLL